MSDLPFANKTTHPMLWQGTTRKAQTALSPSEEGPLMNSMTSRVNRALRISSDSSRNVS